MSILAGVIILPQLQRSWLEKQAFLRERLMVIPEESFMKRRALLLIVQRMLIHGLRYL